MFLLSFTDNLEKNTNNTTLTVSIVSVISLKNRNKNGGSIHNLTRRCEKTMFNTMLNKNLWFHLQFNPKLKRNHLVIICTPEKSCQLDFKIMQPKIGNYIEDIWVSFKIYADIIAILFTVNNYF